MDERCVPPDDALSNFRMMREALPDTARIEEKQVHRIRGESTRDDAAGLYVDEIGRSFHLSAGELPVFDVIARRMGRTRIRPASFPESPWSAIAAESRRRCLWRNRNRRRIESRTLCLAAGGEKAEAIRRVLRGPFDPVETPAQIVSPDTVWYISTKAQGLYCELGRTLPLVAALKGFGYERLR